MSDDTSAAWSIWVLRSIQGRVMHSCRFPWQKRARDGKARSRLSRWTWHEHFLCSTSSRQAAHTTAGCAMCWRHILAIAQTLAMCRVWGGNESPKKLAMCRVRRGKLTALRLAMCRVNIHQRASCVIAGMSYVAAMFLLNVTHDHEAFMCFANLLHRPILLAFYRMDEYTVCSHQHVAWPAVDDAPPFPGCSSRDTMRRSASCCRRMWRASTRTSPHSGSAETCF